MGDGPMMHRERRYATSIAVQLEMGTRTLSLLTDNVAANGMFLRSDILGDLGERVRLQATLGFDLGTIEMEGLVAHVVPPRSTARRIPGMGIALFGLDGEIREAWDRFIAECDQRAPEEGRQFLVAHRVHEDPPEALHRSFPSFHMVLEVKVAMVQDLVSMYRRDIARGGMLLRTDEEVEVGEGFALRIVHPARGDTLTIPVIVRRLVHEPDFRGVGVELMDLDDGARALFWHFIGTRTMKVEESEIVLIEEPP